MLPTIVMTWITDGQEGLQALKHRTLAFRGPMRWYVFALLGVPLSTVALWAAFSGPPQQTPESGPWLVLAASFLLQLVVVFVTFNPVGGTGLDGVRPGPVAGASRAMRAALLTGPLFALGHSSQIIIRTAAPLPLERAGTAM